MFHIHFHDYYSIFCQMEKKIQLQPHLKECIKEQKPTEQKSKNAQSEWDLLRKSSFMKVINHESEAKTNEHFAFKTYKHIFTVKSNKDYYVKSKVHPYHSICAPKCMRCDQFQQVFEQSKTKTKPKNSEHKRKYTTFELIGRRTRVLCL